MDGPHYFSKIGKILLAAAAVTAFAVTRIAAVFIREDAENAANQAADQAEGAAGNSCDFVVVQLTHDKSPKMKG